ncbi:MAG: hypothetical protein JNJ48_02465 [Phycisphaerae bacterium]|nr:hypothetical protein [Phycisphaerae bacterium]
MSASFEEKSVWVQLLCLVAGLGTYFVLAGEKLASGERAMAAYTGLFVGATVAMVTLMVAGHIVLAVWSKPEGADERDRLIWWRSEYNASWVVAAGVCGGVTCMALGVENVWTAHLLLLSLAGSQVLCAVLRLVQYRRGA